MAASNAESWVGDEILLSFSEKLGSWNRLTATILSKYVLTLTLSAILQQYSSRWYTHIRSRIRWPMPNAEHALSIATYCWVSPGDGPALEIRSFSGLEASWEGCKINDRSLIRSLEACLPCVFPGNDVSSVGEESSLARSCRGVWCSTISDEVRSNLGVAGSRPPSLLTSSSRYRFL